MVDALPAYLLRYIQHSSVSSDGIRRAQPQAPQRRLLTALIAAVVALPMTSLADNLCHNPHAAAQQQAKNLDWVPLSELTETQRAAMPSACCGAYVTPPRSDTDALAEPSTSTLRARADNSEAQLQSKIVMSGEVQITQGYRSVQADQATYDQIKRQAEISGNIQLREPGYLFRAERAQVDIDQGDARLENAQFVLQETRIRGQADRLEKFGDRLISMKGSRFTSCEPGNNTWAIAGSEINLHPEAHYGTAKHMRLNILDVPVIYVPYMRFPVGKERLTGFLFPSLGFDPKHGLDDVETPFYWNLAPNYDALLTPRYMSEHGGIMDIELRHLSKQFETDATISYMGDDRGNYQDQDLQRIAQGLKTDYTGEERWLMKLDQTGGKGERWSTRIDYTDLSDTDYLLDVNGSALDANRQAYITKLAAADYRSDHWLLGIKAEEFRLLTEGQLPYRELPQINADGHYRIDDWQLELEHEYTQFDRNSHYTGNADTLIVGERLRTDYRLTWDKDLQWGFVKPGIAYKTLSYQLDTEALVNSSNNSPKLQSPQASLDTGLYFEREQVVSERAFIQTLEPRLFYLYSDYEDHRELYQLTSDNRYINFDTAALTFNYNQLFRDTRFAGSDRIDDANQVSLGLSTAWIEQATGIERLRMSIGQIIYFDDRKVDVSEVGPESELNNDSSPIAAQISGQLGNGLRLSGDLFYDHRDKQVDGINASLRYIDADYRIFNLSYRYTRDPVIASPLTPTVTSNRHLDQLDASVIWPVANQWSLIARSNYDFEYNLELDTFVGLEYNDCCYRVRIMARRWLDFDYSENFLQRVTSNDYRQAPMLDIQFKGLGTLSERIGNLLDKAIVGYSEREKSLR